jgi:hypothetical protein
MPFIATMRRLAAAAAGLAALLAVALPAAAHHGWAWTEDGFFEITGKIVAIGYGNPHPTLDVEVEGEVWRVDLATPRATANAGFMEDTAEVGDEVTAIGNRSRDDSQRLMKAVRIIVDGTTYDVYPNRTPD